MSRRTDEILKLIERCTDDEKRLILGYLRERISIHSLEDEWNTTAEAILTAIARSADITLRGVRGILAEATFEGTVIKTLQDGGWEAVNAIGEYPYDFLVRRDAKQVTIQVKMQRKEKGVPKIYATKSRRNLNCQHESMFVVEVQKTRTGKKAGQATRPYRFGDFDILAVNLHSSTGDWKRFLYTVGTWLIPRSSDSALIEVMQPVPSKRDEYWTDDVNAQGEQHSVLEFRGEPMNRGALGDNESTLCRETAYLGAQPGGPRLPTIGATVEHAASLLTEQRYTIRVDLPDASSGGRELPQSLAGRVCPYSGTALIVPVFDHYAQVPAQPNARTGFFTKRELYPGRGSHFWPVHRPMVSCATAQIPPASSDISRTNPPPGTGGRAAHDPRVQE
jgi:hypothetical protein